MKEKRKYHEYGSASMNKERKQKRKFYESDHSESHSALVIQSF